MPSIWVSAPKLLVFFPKKEQMEKSEMKEQEESRGRECKKNCLAHSRSSINACFLPWQRAERSIGQQRPQRQEGEKRVEKAQAIAWHTTGAQ